MAKQRRYRDRYPKKFRMKLEKVGRDDPAYRPSDQEETQELLRRLEELRESIARDNPEAAALADKIKAARASGELQDLRDIFASCYQRFLFKGSVHFMHTRFNEVAGRMEVMYHLRPPPIVERLRASPPFPLPDLPPDDETQASS